MKPLLSLSFAKDLLFKAFGTLEPLLQFPVGSKPNFFFLAGQLSHACHYWRAASHRPPSSAGIFIFINNFPTFSSKAFQIPINRTATGWIKYTSWQMIIPLDPMIHSHESFPESERLLKLSDGSNVVAGMHGGQNLRFRLALYPLTAINCTSFKPSVFNRQRWMILLL